MCRFARKSERFCYKYCDSISSEIFSPNPFASSSSVSTLGIDPVFISCIVDGDSPVSMLTCRSVKSRFLITSSSSTFILSVYLIFSVYCMEIYSINILTAFFRLNYKLVILKIIIASHFQRTTLVCYHTFPFVPARFWTK